MGGYDPETLDVLREALDQAWALVPAAGRNKFLKTDMAKRILRSAASGERDVERLRAAALAGTGMTLAYRARAFAARRRRFKQVEPLEQRLALEAKQLRDEARLLPPGVARERALRKARQAETAVHLSDWLRSPGLRPPT